MQILRRLPLLLLFAFLGLLLGQSALPPAGLGGTIRDPAGRPFGPPLK